MDEDIFLLHAIIKVMFCVHNFFFLWYTYKKNLLKKYYVHAYQRLKRVRESSRFSFRFPRRSIAQYHFCRTLEKEEKRRHFFFVFLSLLPRLSQPLPFLFLKQALSSFFFFLLILLKCFTTAITLHPITFVAIFTPLSVLSLDTHSCFIKGEIKATFPRWWLLMLWIFLVQLHAPLIKWYQLIIIMKTLYYYS